MRKQSRGADDAAKNNLLSLPVLILICILWIAPGMIGREPWKADEPYTFGIVAQMMRTGDWVVPSLTGEPFLEKPPVFFVTAAAFARTFSPPLELYDAARFATAFFIGAAFLFFALAARELYGKEYAVLAVILLIGCVQLQVTAHKLITDVALFAGFAIAFYGLALAARRPLLAGFWIGTGTGIGFLAKGLLAPGILGIVAALLPVVFRQWRRREYAWSLAAALGAALPWLLVWPTALYRRSPDLFRQWFWDQNLGRFLGFNAGKVGFNAAAPDAHRYYLVNLVWLAWPVVLPAAWSLWHFRRSWRTHPAFQIPLAGFVVILGVLSASSTNRVLYALPLLLPVTLIALAGVIELPERAKAIVNTASVYFWAVIALILWLGWAALMTGTPASLAKILHDFQPDYVPSVRVVLLAAALFYTGAWLFYVMRALRSPGNFALTWCLGVVLTWALVMTLWLPALNSGSSYRADFTDLKRALPAGHSCVASIGLGESERAMLEFYTGISTRRSELYGPGPCELLLEQRGGKGVSLVRGDWRKIWEYRHPSTMPKDIFALYTKAGSLPAGGQKRAGR